MKNHDPSYGSHAPSSGSDAATAMPVHQTDLLSQVLSLVRLRGDIISTAELHAADVMDFAPGPCHFLVVERGALWVTSDGEQPLQLQAGDLLLLLHGKGHSVSVGAVAVSRDSTQLTDARGKRAPGKTSKGEGVPCACVVGGMFRFEGAQMPPILAALPPSIYLPHDTGPSPLWLTAISEFLVDEAQSSQPGSALMISRLIDLLVIRTLRAWVQGQPAMQGWLAGLKEERIGRVLAAIHGDPFRSWTVSEMAAIAAMSRSAFAERFTETVGSPPLRYLTHWKLSLASDLLKLQGLRVTQVAQRVGYESEAAFSRAYKSLYGQSPSEARTTPHPTLDSGSVNYDAVMGASAHRSSLREHGFPWRTPAQIDVGT